MKIFRLFFYSRSLLITKFHLVKISAIGAQYDPWDQCLLRNCIFNIVRSEMPLISKFNYNSRIRD